MAANLDYKEDGTAAVVSIGESMWHREGSVFLDRTSPEAMEIAANLDRSLEIAGLDFEVATRESYFIGADGQPVRGRGRDVIRLDRMESIGNVGDDYKPLQNRKAFEPARALLEKGIATVETAGALDKGADVWLLLRLVPSKLMAAAEEALLKSGKVDSIARRIEGLGDYLSECLPFAHFSNHHGGKRAATVQETAVRVICANTQSAALDGKAEGIRISMRHTGDVEQRYSEAVGQLMQGIAARYLSLAGAHAALNKVTLSSADFERLVLDTAIPVKHLEERIRTREGAEGAARTMASIKKNHELRDEIARLWTAGKGHSGNRSAWEAFQGLIEFEDHSTMARVGGSRLTSNQSGTIGKVKARVYTDLVQHVTDHAPDVVAALS